MSSLLPACTEDNVNWTEKLNDPEYHNWKGIVIGETTKQKVLEIMGKPSNMNNQTRYSYKVNNPVSLDSRRLTNNVRFNSNDVVSALILGDPEWVPYALYDVVKVLGDPPLVIVDEIPKNTKKHFVPGLAAVYPEKGIMFDVVSRGEGALGYVVIFKPSPSVEEYRRRIGADEPDIDPTVSAPNDYYYRLLEQSKTIEARNKAEFGAKDS